MVRNVSFRGPAHELAALRRPADGRGDRKDRSRWAIAAAAVLLAALLAGPVRAQPADLLLEGPPIGHTEEAYPGSDSEAPWRAAARGRIATHRTGSLSVRVLDAAGRPVSGARVEVAMEAHAFEFGSAVTAQMLTARTEDGRRYRAFVRSRLGRAVFENDLKWGPWAEGATDTDDRYRRAWVAAAFDSLEAWQIDVRGHYGMWGPLEGGSAPEDLTGDAVPDSTQPEAVRRAWTENVERRVPAVEALGRPSEWDAVNHPVGWGPTTVGEVAGWSFYADVLRRMEDLAPRAELWVNEGGVLAGHTIDAYLRVIERMRAAGRAPDGIGVMGHFRAERAEDLPDPKRIVDRLDRLSAHVPRLQVTELDVTVPDDTLQARYLRDVLIAAYSHPDVEGALLWGFWAGRHWRPEAALYREDWTPEPAARVFDRLLFECWWTEVSGRTGSDGRYGTDGHLGTYRVRVTAPEGTAVRTAELDRDGTSIRVMLDGGS